MMKACPVCSKEYAYVVPDSLMMVFWWADISAISCEYGKCGRGGNKSSG